MKITISGTAGSGKSTVARQLAGILGMKHYSVGDIRREMAKKRNMSLAEFNKMGEEKDFTDKEADDYQIDLGEKEDCFVIDGRLSYHFIPESLKIYLKAHVRTRAERIYNDERAEEKFRDLGDAIASLIERDKSDKTRYLRYYNLDPSTELQFDLVLDTTYLNVEEIIAEILKFIKQEKIISSKG